MMRVLIVDDEELARERMAALLAGIPDVAIAGEAADGEEAVRQIAALRPDVVLIDIQIPGPSGLEVAASLPQPRPAIVFCTAYDEYAVQAFDVNAVDYLLKPVSRERLARAMERVRFRDRDAAEAALDRVTRPPRGPAVRILARCGDRLRIVPQREVAYFSSAGGLTRLHTRDREYLVDPTLNEIEARVDPALFFRVSRSAIVNLDFLTDVLPLSAGIGDIVLSTGARLAISRRRLRELLDRLAG